jgi:hypothetical protein
VSSSSSPLPEQQSRAVVAARALIMLFVLVGVPVCAFFYAPVRSLIDPVLAMLQEEDASATDDPFSESMFEGDWAQPPLELNNMSPSGTIASRSDDTSPFAEVGSSTPWAQEITSQGPLVHHAGPLGTTPREQLSSGSSPSTQGSPWLTGSPMGITTTVDAGAGTGLTVPPNWGGEATTSVTSQQPNMDLNAVVNSHGMGGLPNGTTPLPPTETQAMPHPVLPTHEELALFEKRFTELNAITWTLSRYRSPADGQILYHFTCDVASPDGLSPSQFVNTDSTAARAMQSVLFQVENWQVANANRLGGPGQRIGTAPNRGEAQRYPWQ